MSRQDSAESDADSTPPAEINLIKSNILIAMRSLFRAEVWQHGGCRQNCRTEGGFQDEPPGRRREAALSRSESQPVRQEFT